MEIPFAADAPSAVITETRICTDAMNRLDGITNTSIIAQWISFLWQFP